MTEAKQVRAGCLCGAVQFTLDLPSKWCAHCHCSMCRKEHGAGYVTWAGFPEQAMHLQAGKEQLHWYRSSPSAERGFCTICGSSMLFRSTRWPGEIHVALGCINDPIDRAPQAHVFHDTRVSWMALDDDLEIYNPS